MPKKLDYKICPFCGAKIIGKKRKDRNSYQYSPRCPDCAYKALTESVKATKLKVISKVRVTRPVGFKRLRKSKEGLVYAFIKVAEPNIWDYEHRVVTNAPKGTHVHHINGNTLDNRVENLLVLTHAEHMKEHLITQWARKHKCCVDCGTTEKRHLSRGLCTICYQRKYKPKTKRIRRKK